MVAITRMYLSQSMKGVLHVHRRQRMQTCHLAKVNFRVETKILVSMSEEI
jgi:hypothetical protein